MGGGKGPDFAVPGLGGMSRDMPGPVAHPTRPDLKEDPVSCHRSLLAQMPPTGQGACVFLNQDQAGVGASGAVI